MKSVLDPTFQYTPSLKTDLRKTFARVRREMKVKQQQVSAVDRNVLPLLPAPKRNRDSSQ